MDTRNGEDKVNPDLKKSLEDLVLRRDLILVTGKGGVGKSTLVAALARLAVKQRGGAIALESAAHSRLLPLLKDQKGIITKNIDLDLVLSSTLKRALNLPAIVAAMMNNRIMRLYMHTSPAVGELVLLDAIASEVNSPQRKGPVIVDLPASGHAMELLKTPNAVRKIMHDSGPVAKMARNLENLLTDTYRTELLVVALPEELPVNETIELINAATRMGIKRYTVLVNQVPEKPCQETRLIEFLAGFEELEQVAKAAFEESLSSQRAHKQIQRLEEALGTVLELPCYLDEDPRKSVMTYVLQ